MSYCDMPPEFFNETKQKARKGYVCCECGHKILKGESYWKSVGKWDGEINSYKQHPWCRAACTHLSALSSDGCISFTAMWDEWGDFYWHGGRKEERFKKLRGYIAKAKWEGRKPERRVRLVNGF